MHAPDHPGGASPRIGTWVIEDDSLYRDVLTEVLAADPRLEVRLAVGAAEPAVEALRTEPPPDVVLMDLELPGMGGAECTREIAAVHPETDVIVLTIHQSDERVFRALCAGARGYLVKPSSEREIIDAVLTAHRGGAPMDAHIARRVLDVFSRVVPSVNHSLTARQTEVLDLLAQGKTKAEIADALYLSAHTVDSHLRNIYSKLHVNSQTAAVAKAIRDGVI